MTEPVRLYLEIGSLVLVVHLAAGAYQQFRKPPMPDPPSIGPWCVAVLATGFAWPLVVTWELAVLLPSFMRLIGAWLAATEGKKR